MPLRLWLEDLRLHIEKLKAMHQEELKQREEQIEGLQTALRQKSEEGVELWEDAKRRPCKEI